MAIADIVTALDEEIARLHQVRALLLAGRRGSEQPWCYVFPVWGELDQAGSQAQAIERSGTCENFRRSEKKVG